MFQTKVEIPKTELTINYENHIMTFGSCFAENIGYKMKDVYFETLINPFGVLYNPVSISNGLRLLLENMQFAENDLFQHRGLWNSFAHSGMFSAMTPKATLEKINEKCRLATSFLSKTDFLLITFGTAWVYEERKSGRVVSNCHKLPANQFNRRRLTVEEIIEDYSLLINQLTDKFSNIQLIISVSPIRHWKDGAHENNVSKSTLLLAIEAVQKQFKNVHYFPAYEIQLDELRDYRFYAPDMFHPSEVAVDYIWKRFSETYFDEVTTKMKKEFEQLQNDLLHRPLFPETDEFHFFQESIKKRKSRLIADFPFLKDRIK